MISKGPQYEVKVLQTLEEIEQLRAIWEPMQWNPESDLDFVLFILRIRPEIIRPHVVVVIEDDQPVALVVGRLEHSHFAIKLGYKVIWSANIQRIAIFYGGFMGKTDATTGEVAVQSLLRSLRDEKVDLLSWSGIQRGSVLQSLLSKTPNFLCRDRLARFIPHWTMKMPASVDDFLKQRLNKKQRYNTKRAIQMIEKNFPGQVRYASYSALDDIDGFFEHVVKVAKTTYQWGLGVGFQGSKENKERLLLETGKGWFRGHILFVKDEPVAFWIATVFNETVYMDYTGYNPGFRDYEVGTALFFRMVGELCQENVKQLDFGPGTAFYKEQFGDTTFEEATYCAFPATFRGMAFCGLNLATQGPLELGRSVLKRFGLEQKLKKVWRKSMTPSRERKESSQRSAARSPDEAGEAKAL